jgi:hypothetical protein
MSVEKIVSNNVTLRFIQRVPGGPVVLRMEGVDDETGVVYRVDTPAEESVKA